MISLNSMEIVDRAITFRNPPRIPYNFEIIGHTDFAYLGACSLPRAKRSETEEIDEWGCVWKKWGNGGLIGEPIDSPLRDWGRLKDYEWPHPGSPGRLEHIESRLAHTDNKFVLASIEGILRRARLLRGFSNLMADLYLEPQRVRELLERITDFNLGVIKRYGGMKGIHGVEMPEDWGTQTQPFVRTPMFREFFSPIYKKVFDAVHENGWIFRMHSDGRINDLIEEFIDCGLDVIELEQPRALGIEEIGQRYKGRICFEASVDIQATLPKMDREAIREEVKELFENWATPRGGFIAVCYHCTDIGISKDTVNMVFEEFRKLGDPGTQAS